MKQQAQSQISETSTKFDSKNPINKTNSIKYSNFAQRVSWLIYLSGLSNKGVTKIKVSVWLVIT